MLTGVGFGGAARQVHKKLSVWLLLGRRTSTQVLAGGCLVVWPTEGQQLEFFVSHLRRIHTPPSTLYASLKRCCKFVK